MSNRKTLTLEELDALPDEKLNALAATLVMGWQIGGLLGKEEIDVWRTGQRMADGYERQIRPCDWEPTTDYNQSLELLLKIAERGVEFSVWIDNNGPQVSCRTSRGERFNVTGNSPRDQAIAAILAAQVLEGKQ